jgi:hypothetical protein
LQGLALLSSKYSYSLSFKFCVYPVIQSYASSEGKDTYHSSDKTFAYSVERCTIFGGSFNAGHSFFAGVDAGVGRKEESTHCADLFL